METKNHDVFNEFNEEKKQRPRGLIILISLSMINILSSLWTSINSYFTGPLSEDELDSGLKTFYESLATLEEQGASDTFITMINQVIDYSIYVNFNTFNLNQVLLIFTL